MRPVLVLVTNVVLRQSSHVPLIENDHVIQELAPHTADPALSHAVLPRTAEAVRTGWQPTASRPAAYVFSACMACFSCWSDRPPGVVFLVEIQSGSAMA